MSPFLKTSGGLAILSGFLGSQILACGPWLPYRYLSEGGSKILEAPEFYLELELKTVARDKKSAFKAVPANYAEENAYAKHNRAADAADFEDALKTGRIAPPDPETARSAHLKARDLANGNGPEGAAAAVSEEFESEFALYHRGAIAFRQSKPEEAREAFTAVLARPAEARHYRSTWAAFMLGKLAMASDPAAAPAFFQQTRTLAKEGFADSLGLAAASLGWEARVALDAGEWEKAAALYTEQLATGDLSAVDSLLSVASEATAEGDDLSRAAHDATLRRVVTALILTREVNPASEEEAKGALMERWLKAVESAGIKGMGEADRIAWAAYSAGRFKDAARWLKRAEPDSGLSLWLQAKLEFRAGHVAQATALMARALPKIPTDDHLEMRDFGEMETAVSRVAAADLGLLRVARSEFVTALRAFVAGDHWQDAAYIAERVLTPKELMELVDREFPAVATPPPKKDEGELFYSHDLPAATSLRWLLARRLVRLGRLAEARKYFGPVEAEILGRYLAATRKANDPKAPKAQRADALWEAAQIARKDGMELMGTELEPDFFIWKGEFEEDDVRAERLSGRYEKTTYTGTGSSSEPRPLVIALSAEEKRRMAKEEVHPDARFHYRYVAAEMAWQAAQWMPDNTEKTATVLNAAGKWLKDRDEKAADRFYQALESRCPKTELGAEAIRLHWFP